MYLACRDVGFLYIVGHSIPQERIDEMFAQSKRLFALPVEAKMLAPHPPKVRGSCSSSQLRPCDAPYDLSSSRTRSA